MTIAAASTGDALARAAQCDLRLSLNGCLEGRPVIVFDEWAADQDPAFRRVFYEEPLPDLKRLGKTMVVISHDDHYFSAADRIVRRTVTGA